MWLVRHLSTEDVSYDFTDAGLDRDRSHRVLADGSEIAATDTLGRKRTAEDRPRLALELSSEEHAGRGIHLPPVDLVGERLERKRQP